MGNLRHATLLVLLAGLSLREVASQDPRPPVYRLPPTLSPRLYTLELDPDMDSGVVRGSVRIEVLTTSNQSETLDSVTLHFGRNDMTTVNETTGVILNMDGSLQHIGSYDYDSDNTLLILRLPDGQTLSHGSVYVISLHFQSQLNTDSKGLFIGNYNSTSKYIASNFRPSYARDVFPCFDEPHFKVPVTLQVWRPTTHYALSSAPWAYSSGMVGGKVLDTFETTGPISIHSLGLFIGQQPPMESMGVQVVVPPSLPPSAPHIATLVAEITAQIGPFPSDPLTLIVLPDRTYTSFSSCGFVFTSPEIYSSEVDSQLQWSGLYCQLAEEFLRQLLEFSKTPQWWSELWLSESVGSFLSFSLVEIDPWVQNWLNIVVRSEALASTVPVIVTPYLTKWDVENLISNQTIKYKGLSTLLMWNATMPEGLVKDTMIQFVKLPQSVVNTSDLVGIMVENINASSSTYDVTPAVPLLANWLTQPSSPLVRFSIDNSSSFSLAQGSPLRPVSVAVAEGASADWAATRQARWLLTDSAHFPFPNISEDSVINIETGPYRVAYADSQWAALREDVVAGWAPAAVASALADDAVALALGGQLNFSLALALLNTSRSDLEWWPVVTASQAITANIGDDEYGRSAFGLYFASLFSAELLQQLDLRDAANHTELTVARELVTPWLCQFNISTCREAAVQLGGPLWQGNTSGIAGSDLENVACYGARYTPGALGPLLGAYLGAETPRLRRLFTIALSCLTEPVGVSGLLNVIINVNSTQAAFRIEDSQATLNQSDAQQILIGLASTLENAQTVLDFVVSQSTYIQEKFGVSTLSSVIKSLARNRINLSQLSSLIGDQDLDQYVWQAASETLALYNLSQTWYNDYSQQLYQYLPAGEEPTTTTAVPTTAAPTTAAPTTAAPTTSRAPTSAPPTPTPTHAPGSASPLSDRRVFTFALSALLIILDFTLC